MCDQPVGVDRPLSIFEETKNPSVPTMTLGIDRWTVGSTQKGQCGLDKVGVIRIESHGAYNLLRLDGVNPSRPT
jgi:hypothetical protein